MIRHEQLKIFENASDAVLISDSAQRIVFCNQKAGELLGYRAKEVTGKLCYKIVGSCAKARSSAASFCQASCAALDAARSGRALRRRKLILQGTDGAETVVNVDHTFLFPDGAAQSQAQTGEFLVMHLFREVAAHSPVQSGLRIHLLGKTRVQLPYGEQLEASLWQRTMVRAMLALLALHRRQGIHRDELVDLLWRDKEREAALANLNTTVYYLRRALQPNLRRGEQSRYIQIEGELYRLSAPEAHWLDVEAFDETTRRARVVTTAGEAIALYENALGLYQGDFLADLDFAGGPYLSRQTYLRERFLAVMKELAALYESEGNERRAEEMYLRILGYDELQEDACRQAMHLMLRRGSRADAIACFQRLAKHLKEDLGLNPERATVALYVQAQQTSPFAQSRANGGWKTPSPVTGTGRFSV